MTSSSLFTLLVTALVAATVILTEPTWAKAPEDFPASMTLFPYNFTRWVKYKTIPGVWLAFPKTEQDILDAVNWARKAGYRIRASGFQHNWSPITVTEEDRKNTTEDGMSRVILLKTARYLNKMGIISNVTGRSSFWAQSGTKLRTIVRTLEQNNLGFANFPDIDEPTLGGALAIGAHGTSIHLEGQRSQAGHTHGTLSNLVISLTAVVFDRKLDQYVLKTFPRFHSDAKYFLTSLGRTFITNVTMRVGPLINYRVQSYLDIPPSRLFRSPSQIVEKDGAAFRDYLKDSNALLATMYPYTDIAWVKSYTAEQWKPRPSRKVNGPYNYPSSAADDKIVRSIIAKIESGQPEETINLGKALADSVNHTLVDRKAADIWGSAPNTQVFTEAAIIPWKLAGYAFLTTRDKVQEVSSQIYHHYIDVRDEFQSAGQYPFTGTLEIRVTGVDDPRDCLVSGAEAPAISAVGALPRSENGDDDDILDVAVWASLKYMANTPGIFAAARRFEQLMIREDAGFEQIRPEWCKEWAYSEQEGPWHKEAAPQLFNSFSRAGKLNYWRDMGRTLKAYDPHGVLSSSFLDDLLDGK